MENQFTREEIRQNRIKFAKGLQEPQREKATGMLEDFEFNNQRCCLGHGCDIFDLKREILDKPHGKDVAYGEERNESVAPKELIDLLGLHNQRGGTKCDIPNEPDVSPTKLYEDYTGLTTLNDQSKITIQEIGVLIEGWIEGGDNTPFIPLSNYSE